MKTAPHPIGRCGLERFIWERGLILADLAQVMGCSIEHARRCCLPFPHPDRKTPNPDQVERIYAWSEGAVSAADHYPPPKPLAGLNGETANGADLVAEASS